MNLLILHSPSQQIGENERQVIDKLHKITSFIAFKRHLFLDFLDHIELEKLHDVKYTGAYEKKKAHKDFMLCISEYMFDGSGKESPR